MNTYQHMTPIERFATLIGKPLYPYQAEVANVIIHPIDNSELYIGGLRLYWTKAIRFIFFKKRAVFIDARKRLSEAACDAIL